VVLRTILRHARHIDAMTTDPFAGIDPKTLRSLRRANIAFVDDCVFVDDQLAPAKPGAAAGTGIGTNRFPLTPDL